MAFLLIQLPVTLSYGVFFVLYVLAQLKGFGDQEALNRLQTRLFVFGYGAIIASFYYHILTLIGTWACSGTIFLSLLSGLLNKPALQKISDSFYGLSALGLWATNFIVILLKL